MRCSAALTGIFCVNFKLKGSISVGTFCKLLFNPHINSFYALLSFKQHLFNRVGSNTKDQQDSNGLNEVDVGDREVVHVPSLALTKGQGIDDEKFF